MKHRLSVLLAYYLSLLQIRLGLGLSTRKMRMLLNEISEEKANTILMLFFSTFIKDDNLLEKKFMVSEILNGTTRHSAVSKRILLNILGSDHEYAHYYISERMWERIATSRAIQFCSDFSSLITLTRWGLYALGNDSQNGRLLLEQVIALIERDKFSYFDMVEVLYRQRAFLSTLPTLEDRIVITICRYSHWDAINRMKHSRDDLSGNINFYINKYRKRKKKRRR